jgi:polyisoprenoid-binding protein YceI
MFQCYRISGFHEPIELSDLQARTFSRDGERRTSPTRRRLAVKPFSKKIALAFGTLLALGLTTGMGLAATQTYSTAKSPEAKAEFNFRVTLIPVPGTVKAVGAKINFDPKNLSAINGTVEVDLTKLETGIGLRDQHAKDALGAEKFPKAIFKIKSLKGLKTLEANKEYKATAVGDFTLKGITKALEAPIELKFDGKNINVSTAFDVLIADHKIEITGADPKVDVKVNFTLEPGN